MRASCDCELSRLDREVLEWLVCGDPRLVLHGANLIGLVRRGLVECRLDGWGITSAGREALRTDARVRAAASKPPIVERDDVEVVPDGAAILLRRHVLLVEDDYLLARQMKTSLEGRGAVVLGPAAANDHAMELARSAPRLDCAVVDLDLDGRSAIPVATELAVRRVPFVVVTGCEVAALPAPLERVPICLKPATVQQIETALAPGLTRPSLGLPS